MPAGEVDHLPLEPEPVARPDQQDALERDIRQRSRDGVRQPATLRLLHRTIAAVGNDYDNLRFNVAIAKLIELNNALTRLDRAPRALVEPLVAMVAPLAPHIAEELWSLLGHEDSVVFAPFPTADADLLVQERVTCIVQVQGKVRARLDVGADIADAELEAAALAEPRIAGLLTGKQVRKVIVRAPSLVNIVAG